MIASLRTSRTSSGRISGCGLASAKRIGSLASEATMSRVMTPAAERATSTSAPRAPPLVHVLLAAAVDESVLVAHEDVLARDPNAHVLLGAGHRRRAGADEHH